MKFTIILKILLILLIGGIGVQTIFAQELIADLKIEKKDSIAYVNGIDLGKKLKVQMTWQSEAGILKLGNSSWVLGSAWASIKDTSFLLSAPVQKNINDKSSFWLPVPSALQVFEHMSNKHAEYDKDLWSVNLNAKDGGEVVELKFSKPFVAEAFYSKPNYILRINGLAIDSTMFLELAKKSSMLSRVIPIQDKQSAQLTLVLKDNCENAELVKKDGDKTLQIVLRKKTAAAPVVPATIVKDNSTSKKVKTIVIDPGHGGRDPGAVHSSLKEKDIVLAVGTKLKKKLENKGFTVKLTRGSDEFVELEKRPKMASDWGGDLFISLHCDAVDGKERQQKAEGFKFYILRAGGSEEDKAIARRENQAIALESGKKGKTEISPAEWIILDNQLALYAEKSTLLAGYLVEAFDGGTIKKTQTGAGQAGFMVLVGAYMPAVLAELGFITNPRDAEFIGSEKGQEELAERLAKGIEAFAK